MLAQLNLRGHYRLQHFRDGKLIHEEVFKNGITNQGKLFLLDSMFNGATQISTWYLGLIDLSGFTALAADDIYDDINQVGNDWDEFDDYTDPGNADSAVTRPEWTKGAAASNQVTNASTVDFDITDTGTVKGVFLAGGPEADTKGDNTTAVNKLFGTALFGTGDRAVLASDQLRITYTVTS